MTNPFAVSEPPLYDDAGWPELPDVIPDWLLEQGPLPEPFDCGCHAEDPQPEVGWAIPGVTGRSTQPALPPVSPAVVSLQQAADALSATDPSRLASAQALVDSEALLALEQQLRVHNLRRVGDVSARGLHELVGYRTARTWLRAHRPDGDATDATLSTSLRDFPVLRRSVEDGTCPLAAARKVVHALRRCWHHVDRPDGLIDGQPADQVIPAVVRNVVTLVARYLLGLADDDPRLADLVARAEDILAAGGSELQQLEAAFTFLAEEVPARSLTAHLEELVLAVLPSVLEERAENDRAGLTLVRKDDGTGWHVSGDLDLECGERLFTALTAEASRDPQNRTDTQAWCTLREQGDDPWAVGEGLFSGADVLDRPRHKRRRLHDALNRLLARYLEHGLGGTAGKVPVQVHVTLAEGAVTGAPGALPPRADSGACIPRATVRRWWCDSAVTAYVLSLGGKALRVIHGQRTLTGLERRALAIEGGGRCAGDGCCPDHPDPLVVLRPHHARRFADDGVTSIEETLPVCDVLHHDLHEGKRTVRLRDGRYLREDGFVDAPEFEDFPPF